ncbi:helix-turn-helix transcriptional regulator [Alkalicoccus chagannorensis]|uniref:helix-turn-helix transcriptional regulator n=1 Tax=Alkalicoccus chagannorensis TaxID=427072 RepID=UPI0003FB9893|nr:LuxR C-terminal-related transcriptional regulator [Alkalicoccus chagannorensis]
MQQSTSTAVGSRVLVLDHDQYLSQASGQRMQQTFPEYAVTIDQNGSTSSTEAAYIFLLIESADTEASRWVQEKLKEKSEHQHMLVVTVNRPKASLIPYLANGLSGILSLHSFYSTGSSVLDTVRRFGVYLEQPLHNDLVRELHEQKLKDRPIKRLILREEDVLYRLTKNERAVLQHILDGHNNRRIAELMYLAPSTVSTVISHLLKKLGANDRTDAMVQIIKNGWVDALR